MGTFRDKHATTTKSLRLDNVAVTENGSLGEFKWEHAMLLLLFLYLLEDTSTYMWPHYFLIIK